MIFQFVISIVLIIGTSIVLNQVNYMKNRKLGFEKEQLLVIPIRDQETRKKAELIKNVKGKKSGYCLTRDPQKISVLDIHLAFEPEIAVIDCLSKDFDCALIDTCHTNSFWTGLNGVIVDYFSKATLEDLKNKHVFSKIQ